MMNQKTNKPKTQQQQYKNKTTIKNMPKRSAIPELPPGIFGKYDVNFNHKIGTNSGGPTDLTKNKTTMTQDNKLCAAGIRCGVPAPMPLTLKHRCFVCAFAVHVECAMELEQTPKYQTNNGHCNLLCLGCAYALNIQETKETVNISTKNLPQFIRPNYPSLDLIAQDSKAKPTPVAKGNEEKDSSNRHGISDENMETIELDDDEKMQEDDSTATAPTGISTERSNRKETPGQPKESFKKYISLRLKMEENPDPTDTTTTLKNTMDRCRRWLQGIQQIEPSFKLHTANPAASRQGIIHDMKDFPQTLEELKVFFKGARPKAEGGFIYLKVLGSANGTTKNFIGSVDWMHRDRKEFINICQVQAFETQILGWLLYSHRQLDTDKLKQSIQRIEPALKEFDLRFMRISDGKPTGGRFNSEDPRALHVEVALKDTDLARKVFSQVYGTKVTQWPRGVRMRWIPNHTAYADTKSVERFKHLKNRQAGWNKQLQAKTIHHVVNIEAPNLRKGTTSLHREIMAIAPRSGNTNTSLFFSVEEAWKGGGYVFTFHPDKREEAGATIRGLYARMRASFEAKELMNVFTPNAVEEGQRMTWDAARNTAISEEDNMLEELMELDKDMEFEPQATSHRSREIMVYQPDHFGTDDATAASFHTKRSQETSGTLPSKRSRTEKENDDSVSTASSLTATTKATFETRMSKIENAQDKIENMLHIIIQRIPTQQIPNTPSQESHPMEITRDTQAQATPITPQNKPSVESQSGFSARN